MRGDGGRTGTLAVGSLMSLQSVHCRVSSRFPGAGYRSETVCASQACVTGTCEGAVCCISACMLKQKHRSP